MIKKSFSIIKNNGIILKGFSFIFGLRILQMVLGFASTYFLARAISVEQYGHYSFVLSSIGIASIFSLPEMNNATTQSIARGFYGAYRAAFKKTVKYSLIGTCILWTMAIYYRFTDASHELTIALCIAGIGLPLSSSLMQWKSLRMAEQKFGEMSRIDAINSTVTCVAIISSVTLIPGNYVLPLCLSILIPAIRNSFLVLSDLKKIPLNSPIEEGSIEYGIKTSFFSGLNLIASNLDRFILFFFLPAASVALFAAADRMSDVFKSLTQDLSAAMAPKFAKHGSSYTKDMDRIFLLYSAVMAICMVLFAFAILPYALVFVFSDKYVDAIPYAQALICSITIGNTSTIRFRYIRSKIDFKSYQSVTLWHSISRIGSLLVLVPLFGIWGAVASAFISRIATAYIIQEIISKAYLGSDGQ